MSVVTWGLEWIRILLPRQNRAVIKGHLPQVPEDPVRHTTESCKLWVPWNKTWYDDKKARGRIAIKNLANVITSTRFLFAVGMVLADPFSAAFWTCYLCGGVSDLLDGALTRRLKTQSAAGAKLDSAADLVFAAAIAAFAVRHIRFPAWLWACAGGIAALRLAGYGVGFAKYHTFSALHTYANKAAGALIFAFPVLYAVLGLTAAGIILCAAALFSSIEELVITISAPVLNRDCRCLFLK